jgi:hypothetical protein
MKTQFTFVSLLALISAATLQSCAQPQVEVPTEAAGSGETGTLEIRANGEDFVRQGFTSKDGWQVDFEHLYINFADVTAYQTDPPYDPQAGETFKPIAEVSLDGVKTIDLAEGDENADPLLVGKVEAPAGRYNALSWQMVAAEDGAAAGYPMVMQGTATKGGETVNFAISVNEPLGFSCGDFVGDERKGIVGGDAGDLEATFHFDHLFGDGDAAPEEEINTGALGFDPLAAIAQNGELTADLEDLEAQLSPEDYTKLLEILPSLGHVGEGHCAETVLTS